MQKRKMDTKYISIVLVAIAVLLEKLWRRDDGDVNEKTPRGW